MAFDLPTAVAFHVMRAVESVLRLYHKFGTGYKGQKPVEMAQCINELRKANADEKTLGILDQIRDLHRNTVMHPEAFLEMPEALRLFDISKSAISAMADQIQSFLVTAEEAAEALAADASAEEASDRASEKRTSEEEPSADSAAAGAS